MNSPRVNAEPISGLVGFIQDTDADPSETRAAKISGGLKKYIVSRANSEFSRVLASINRDRDQAKKTDHPKNEPATCCNPNLYDCHCPFPDDGLAVLASLPPVHSGDQLLSSLPQPRPRPGLFYGLFRSPVIN